MRIVDSEAAHDGHIPRPKQTEELLVACRQAARRLGVPVITTTQVSRQVDRRLDKRPMLSDLSGAPQVEEIADLVVVIYRDEMYDPDTPDRGIAELEVLKHRWGPTGTVKTAFIGPRYTYMNLSRAQPHR